MTRYIGGRFQINGDELDDPTDFEQLAINLARALTTVVIVRGGIDVRVDVDVDESA
jgi:hypothetical protein